MPLIPIKNDGKVKLSPTVKVLGWISFFTDVSSEMIYPLLPLFLTTVLGADKMVLGIIEGVAESTSSVFKMISGGWTDRFGARKPFIVLGYTIPSLVRPLIGLAGSWPMVLLLRFIDRIGKGIRSSPRDALITDVTPESHRGAAFGFDRAMDHAGAMTGPLIAGALLMKYQWPLKNIFLLAAIPGGVSVLIVLFLLREPKKDTLSLEKNDSSPAPSTESAGSVLQNWKAVTKPFRTYLLILIVFSLGQSTDAFLIMRMNELGVTAGGISLVWALHHLVKMVSSYFFGRAGDRVGHARIVLSGWVLYAIIYFVFAQVRTGTEIIVTFLVYGIFYGLSEPSERALVSTMVAPAHRGSAFGFFNFVVGITALPASLIFGWVWHNYSARAAFTVGAGFSILAAGLFVLFFMRPLKRLTS